MIDPHLYTFFFFNKDNKLLNKRPPPGAAKKLEWRSYPRLCKLAPLCHNGIGTESPIS